MDGFRYFDDKLSLPNALPGMKAIQAAQTAAVGDAPTYGEGQVRFLLDTLKAQSPEFQQGVMDRVMHSGVTAQQDIAKLVHHSLRERPGQTPEQLHELDRQLGQLEQTPVLAEPQVAQQSGQSSFVAIPGQGLTAARDMAAQANQAGMSTSTRDDANQAAQQAVLKARQMLAAGASPEQVLKTVGGSVPVDQAEIVKEAAAGEIAAQRFKLSDGLGTQENTAAPMEAVGEALNLIGTRAVALNSGRHSVTLGIPDPENNYNIKNPQFAWRDMGKEVGPALDKIFAAGPGITPQVERAVTRTQDAPVRRV